MDVKYLDGSVFKTESKPNFGFPHIPSRGYTPVWVFGDVDFMISSCVMDSTWTMMIVW